MPLKAIIFDFDGVLANTMQAHLESEQRVFDELGLKISKGELGKYFGMKVTEFNRRVIKDYNLNASVEEIVAKKYAALYELIEKGTVTAIPGALELAREASEKKLGISIASGSRKEFVERVLEKIGGRELFPVILGEAEVEKGKPEPEIFLKCAEKLGVKPVDCLVLEDAENGVLAAKSAGMKVVAILNEFSGNQDYSKADLRIKSFEEIPLKRLIKWFD